MIQESSNLCLPVGWYHESLLEEAEWYEGEEVQEVCISLLLPSYLSMENTILTVACLCLVSESHNLSLRNSARRTLSSRHRQNRKEIPGKDSNKLVRLSIMFLVLNGECDGLIDGCVLALVRGGSHPFRLSTQLILHGLRLMTSMTTRLPCFSLLGMQCLHLFWTAWWLLSGFGFGSGLALVCAGVLGYGMLFFFSIGNEWLMLSFFLSWLC